LAVDNATTVEQAVIEAFADILPDGACGVTGDSDFFLLGGNSILGAQLVSRLRAVLPVKVTIRDLFRARTAGALAATLRERG
jgi:acyl carrier protein